MKSPKIPRPLKKLLISFSCLLLLFLIAGVVYVYISDQAMPPKKSPTKQANQAEPGPLPKPIQPSPNDPEGVAVQTISNPVSPGDNASLTVETNANSTCSIKVSYGGLAATDSGLVSKPSDDYGSVSWSWTVPTNAPIGSWPVNVSCLFNGKSAVVTTNLQIVKS